MRAEVKEGMEVKHQNWSATVVNVWPDGTADIRYTAGQDLVLDVPVSELVAA